MVCQIGFGYRILKLSQRFDTIDELVPRQRQDI